MDKKAYFEEYNKKYSNHDIQKLLSNIIFEYENLLGTHIIYMDWKILFWNYVVDIIEEVLERDENWNKILGNYEKEYLFKKITDLLNYNNNPELYENRQQNKKEFVRRMRKNIK